MVDQRLVWGGIAVAGGGVAIWMIRRNKKNQAATQQTGTTEYGYGYGYGYGSSGAYGYGSSGYSPYGYGYGPFGLGAYGGSGQYGYGYYGAGVPAQVPAQATNNAQWAQAAMSALTSAGYDATTTLAALGVYLMGGNLTQDQAGIISAALAAEGNPPNSGASGYPPAMHIGGGGGGSGQGDGSGSVTGGGTGNGSGGGTTNVKVPATKGNSAGTAHNKIVAAGLVPIADPDQRSVDVVIKTQPAQGVSVPQGTRVLIVARNKSGQIT